MNNSPSKTGPLDLSKSGSLDMSPADKEKSLSEESSTRSPQRFDYDSCGAMDLSACPPVKDRTHTPKSSLFDEEDTTTKNGYESGHKSVGGDCEDGVMVNSKRKAVDDHLDNKRLREAADEADITENSGSQTADKTLPLKIRNKRKNIKDVITEDKLENKTKTAKAEEKERLLRLTEQQKLNFQIFKSGAKHEAKLESCKPTDASNLVKEGKKDVCPLEEDGDAHHDDDDAEDEDPNNSGMHVNDRLNVKDSQGRVLVNVGHPEHDDGIYLAPQVAASVKPHQIGGIRFLYDNIVQSDTLFKTSPGFGCILAHSMGLGKTLQVISFVDIFLEHTDAKKVLCIVPINTIQNWLAEFNYWLPAKGEYSKLSEKFPNSMKPRNFPIHLLNDSLKNLGQRAGVIGAWDRAGGVLLMGYELYRQLANKKPRKKKQKGSEGPDTDEEDRNKNILNDIQSALVSPGPDLVICDEGHRIKNSHASISQALKQIKTKRRIVLTGYPLQNNLMEYWCMVDFVRPNYLGSKTEFSNMFERPIQNGQCVDSTPKDVRLMKHRAHVLHQELKGFVQRRGHVVLKESLPSKSEHVLLVRLTDFQRKLYRRFMEELISNRCVSNPLKAFAVCCKIWNHPDVLYNFLKRREEVDIDFDPEEVMSFPSSSKGSKTSNNAVSELADLLGQDGKKEEINYDWAQGMMNGYTSDQEVHSNKLQIFIAILEESLKEDDRLLLFSQSLCTLNLLEDFLQKRKLPSTQERWRLGVNYYRLDGSTSALERERLINSFNADTGVKLFLVSTRAGSLGVNLVGANRVVIFDASWNPCHDTQAVCRVYRYGQTKNTHVYRLVADNTLEKKIYDRQINKQGMADRVVDELNPDAHLSSKEVHSLICDEEDDPPISKMDPKKVGGFSHDHVIEKVMSNFGYMLTKPPFAHESLLIDRKDGQLSKEEKKFAEESYRLERTSKISYSRPSYAAFYPKQGTFATNLHNPGSNGFTRNRYYENGKKLDSWVPPYLANTHSLAGKSSSSPVLTGVQQHQHQLSFNQSQVSQQPQQRAVISQENQEKPLTSAPTAQADPEHGPRAENENQPPSNLSDDSNEGSYPTPTFSNVLNPPPTQCLENASEESTQGNWIRHSDADSSGSSSENSESAKREDVVDRIPQPITSQASSYQSAAGSCSSTEADPTLAALIRQGMDVRLVAAPRDITIPNSNDYPISFKKGDTVTLIITGKGYYIRMGSKIVKIRQPAALRSLLGLDSGESASLSHEYSS